MGSKLSQQIKRGLKIKLLFIKSNNNPFKFQTTNEEFIGQNVLNLDPKTSLLKTV